MNSRKPKIGILIPAYNEEVVIKGTIDSLLLAGAAKSDIYVVDDKSTDKTAEMSRACGVSVYTVPVNGGKARAQQQALDYFLLLHRYDWLIFMDGDTKVDAKFMQEFAAAAIAEPDVGLFLGQVKSVKNDHLYSASRAFDYTYGQDVAKQGQSNFNVVFVGPGCASMYNCKVLAKLEIDHMTLAEDMDLTMQVHRAKKVVKYVSGAIVNTQDPSTLHDYHKQVLRWYRGFWQVIRKHKVFAFCKKQPVDIYMMILVADALLLNRILWLGILLWTSPAVVPTVFAIDILCCLAIACWAAFRTKRLDVIYKLPLYYWISYVNFYAYVRAFVEIIVCNKELLAWNKVKRYEFDSHTTT